MVGSMQVPLQLMRPVWQVSPQVPPEQMSPDGHAVPALAPLQSSLAPQCVLLVVGSMQVPPQLMRPVWQVSPQVPAEQTLPDGHAVPRWRESAEAPQ